MPVDWKAGDGFQETVMWTPAEAMKAKSFSDSYAELVKQHCPGDDFMYECAGQGIAFLTGKAMDQAVLAFLLECGTPLDVVETKVLKPSKGEVKRAIKHRLDRQPTPKPTVSDAQLQACVARIDEGFDMKIQWMCFDTGAQAMLVYNDTHNSSMEGGGKPANVEVLAAQKDAGFACDKRGSIMFAPMDTGGAIEGFNPTPVHAEFISCMQPGSAHQASRRV